MSGWLIFDSVNHSCDPAVALDLSSPDRSLWHVRALKDIEVGDSGMPSAAASTCQRIDHWSDAQLSLSVTFFYPSTEWAMAQPFDCKCGSFVRSAIRHTPEY
jgi:hypothetical protein